MRLVELADVCRSSGLRVIEHPGWKTRGHGEMGDVRTITCHHTGGGPRGDHPSLDTVLFGRPGLRGPLAQILLSRAGDVHVLAAGLCWHAGKSQLPDQENRHAIGIEAEASGVGDWDGAPIETYALLAGTLAAHYGATILGHKETCRPRGRKPDPDLSMPRLRQLAKEALMPLSKADLSLITDTPFARNLNGGAPGKETVSLKEFIENTDAKIDNLTVAVRELTALVVGK